MTHAITAAEAAVALAEGRAVVLPTDTVYGLGVAVGPAVDPAELFRLTRLFAGVDRLPILAAPQPRSEPVLTRRAG